MTTIWRPMNCNNSHINSATLMFAALAQFPSQRQPIMPTWSHSELATIWWIGSMTGLVFRLIPFWIHFSGEGSQPSGTSEDTTLSNMARAVQVHPDANSVGFSILLLITFFIVSGYVLCLKWIAAVRVITTIISTSFSTAQIFSFLVFHALFPYFHFSVCNFAILWLFI